MFIKYNRTLRHCYNAHNVIDPICVDNIDNVNEWLTGVRLLKMKQFLMDILISVGGVASEASGVEENHYGLRENTSCLYRRGKAVATSLVEEDDDGVEDDDEQKTRCYCFCH